MTIQKVQVRRSRDDKTPVVVEYDFPRSVEGATKQYGADVTLYLINEALKAQLADDVRRLAVGSKELPAMSEADIQVEIERKWSPRIRSRAAAAVEKARDMVKGLSVEERQKLLAQLRAEETGEELLLDNEVPEEH